VLNNHATLEEVERHWSAPDLFQYVCVVEINNEAEKFRSDLLNDTGS
jgi:hypothetical protein